jgi:hypothetical protein
MIQIAGLTGPEASLLHALLNGHADFFSARVNVNGRDDRRLLIRRGSPLLVHVADAQLSNRRPRLARWRARCRKAGHGPAARTARPAPFRRNSRPISQ